MTFEIITPPVPDLARVKGDTVAEAVAWLIEYFNRHGAPFNYRNATRAIRTGYKGLHKLRLLTAGCASEKTAIGRTSNREVIEAAAPLAFGRSTHVFDLPRRRFVLGRGGRSAGFRLPFFFVENGIIHAYFLQPRKQAALDHDELCMVATIIKRFLLDVEFFGERTEVEFVDVCVPPDAKERVTRVFSLSSLPLWTERRLADRLTLIAEALEIVAKSERLERRPRTGPRPDPEMPLFD